MHPDEIGSVIREGRLENPIEVCDDSDVEALKCDESLVKAEKYSVEGYEFEELETMSDFDLDVVTSNAEEVFGPISRENNSSDARVETLPELNAELRLRSSDELRRAKKRMEYCFMDDYSLKMKSFKRCDRPEYEGEYTFTVRVCVDDSNTVEIMDATTTCKLRKIDSESAESDDEYQPEPELDNGSDVDNKRRKLNRESHLFNLEKQRTKYNNKPLPTKIPVIEINEKASETAEYHWLAKYECIPSNVPFNRFLNKFKNGPFAPKIAEFEDV